MEIRNFDGNQIMFLLGLLQIVENKVLKPRNFIGKQRWKKQYRIKQLAFLLSVMTVN